MHEKNYDSFHMHKKIKDMTRVKKNTNTNHVIKNEKGRIVTDMEENLKNGKIIFRNFLTMKDQSERYWKSKTTKPKIMTHELEHALKSMKNRKATRPTQIPVEVLKRFDEKLLNNLLDFLNTICNTGIIPQRWLRLTFMLTPKKARPCSSSVQKRVFRVQDHCTHESCTRNILKNNT